MAFQKSKETERNLGVALLHIGDLEINILGTTPLLMNRLPKKAMEQLLLPPLTANRAERRSNLKHQPIEEFRNSIYRCRKDDAPTLVHMPNEAFKKAMANAALDTPGATKAEVFRHVQVTNETVHIWGIPELDMRIVRQAGMNKTPDVRTRAIFPKWCAKLEISYTVGIIKEAHIANLMANAGMITGIGDGRIEKGTFNFGGWEVVDSDDARLLKLMKEGGRKAQERAMEKPRAHGIDTEELLAWFDAELIAREEDRKTKPKAKKIAPETAAKQTNGKDHMGDEA